MTLALVIAALRAAWVRLYLWATAPDNGPYRMDFDSINWKVRFVFANDPDELRRQRIRDTRRRYGAWWE